MAINGVLNELWARHVPDKNVYGTSSGGRKIVVAWVFQRKSAPMWAFYDCESCVRNDVVCGRHQFIIRGHHGVQRYIEDGYYWRDCEHPMMPRPPRRNRANAVTSEEAAADLSRILTEVLRLNSPELDDLMRSEVSLRVDIQDEHEAFHRSLWRSFRSELAAIFHRETGVHLPPCSRFPQSNLYAAFREAHRARPRGRRSSVARTVA